MLSRFFSFSLTRAPPVVPAAARSHRQEGAMKDREKEKNRNRNVAISHSLPSSPSLSSLPPLRSPRKNKQKNKKTLLLTLSGGPSLGVLVELQLRALEGLGLDDGLAGAGLGVLVGERRARAGEGDERKQSDRLGGHHFFLVS